MGWDTCHRVKTRTLMHKHTDGEASYHGQSSHSITAQSVWHSGDFVLFKTILSFRLVHFLWLVDFMSQCCHQTQLVGINGPWRRCIWQFNLTTVFIMLLVRREKSLLILDLKSSFEHLLPVSHLNLANAQAWGGCVLNAQCSKECLSCCG